MSDDSYRINDAQQRVMTILLLLAGKEAEGLPQGAIAKAGNWGASMVHNDLRNLREGGFAERLQNGNWRLAPKLVQIAMSYETGLANLKAKVEELQQRFSRLPY